MQRFDRDAYDIILFTLFRTDHEYSSVSLSWAREFARRNRVFYINHPYSLKDLVGNRNNPVLRQRMPDMLRFRIRYEKLPAIPANFLAVQPTLSLPINWLPEGWMYNQLSALNNRVVLSAIRKVVRDFSIRKFIYFNCFDPYFAGHLPSALGAACSVYQCIDDISQDSYSVKHGQHLEAEAIAHSDFALVTSTQLQSILRKHNPDTFVVHNAAELAIFERTLSEEFEMPPEIHGVRGKVIGFTGNLDYLRIDYRLLRLVAQTHADKTLLLVGPINSPEFEAEGLHAMPNVITTGARPIEALPRYLQYMDVCLIPFKCNTLTASIYPLKINEYLAAGRPVVSTSFSADIRSFGNVIYLSENDSDFLRNIDMAIEENANERIEQRIAVAKQNTWTARIEQFWQIAEAHFSRKRKEK
jgi:glycosyltransferase involved in cell wall biosynthesis